jgi:hypothetical protein
MAVYDSSIAEDRYAQESWETAQAGVFERDPELLPLGVSRMDSCKCQSATATPQSRGISRYISEQQLKL